jgi:hypothetical protein
VRAVDGGGQRPRVSNSFGGEYPRLERKPPYTEAWVELIF